MAISKEGLPSLAGSTDLTPHHSQDSKVAPWQLSSGDPAPSAAITPGLGRSICIVSRTSSTD
jgi:hypothetical protein